MEYQVIWTIEVEAESALEAAEQAREIQENVESWAKVFHVRRIEGRTNTFNINLGKCSVIDLND